MQYTLAEKNERYSKICRSFGWQVDFDGDNGTIETLSPNGKEVKIHFSLDWFAEGIITYARTYDPSTHEGGKAEADRLNELADALEVELMAMGFDEEVES